MSRKRPEFAEDVYGGGAKSDVLPTAGGRSTVTVSGGRYGNPSSWALNSSTLSSSSSSSSSFSSFSSTSGGPSSAGADGGGNKANSSLGWHDLSKVEPSGESSTRNDPDGNKSQPPFAELDFQYADCDRYEVELAELYTYSEMEDFLQNFEEFCMYLLRSKHEKTERWVEWSAASKTRLMHDVLQSLDSADANVRLDAARLLLYILQGTYGDYSESDEDEDNDDDENGGSKPRNKSAVGHDHDEDGGENGDEPLDGFFHRVSQRLKKAEVAAGQPDSLTPTDLDATSGGVGAKDRGTGSHEQHCLLNATANAYFVYESGLFQALGAMLACEREETTRRHIAKQHSLSSLNSSVGGASLASGHSAGGGARRSATMADNEPLRVVMNCLYHMVESIRRPELVGQVADFCRTLADRRPRAAAPYHSYTVERLAQLRASFLAELEEPLETTKTPLVISLFQMLSEFVRFKNPHFPIKKILLLIWKTLLATLGGSEELRAAKARKRRALGLPPIEDTLDLASQIKPVPYGENEANDNVFISRLSRIGLRNSKVVSMECGGKMRFLNRQTACASSSGGESQKSQDDDEETTANDKGELPKAGIEPSEADEDADDAFRADEETTANGAEPQRKSSDTDAPMTPKADMDGFSYEPAGNDGKAATPKPAADEDGESRQARCEREFDLKIQQMLARPPKSTAFPRRPSRASVSSSTAGDQTPRAGSPEPGEFADAPPSLPWLPKVREKDVEKFIQKAREKYFGYTLPGDATTTFGLPAPVVHSIDVFRRHIYVSPSDLELAAEDRLNRYRLSQTEIIEDTKIERLYQRMLPEISEYTVSLLKAIFASLPASKMKMDATNILSDVLTPETDTHEMLSSSMSFELSGKNVLEEAVRFAIDVNRHKELIIKASSAILILLMKFFRLGHVYQFETFAQSVALANTIPLLQKFFDPTVRNIKSKHELTPFNYPQCALHYVRNDGEWPVLNADNVFAGEQDERSYYLWRNVFSAVNLLRVCNKLAKFKDARIGMVMAYRLPPILKRCLTIRVGILQFYCLKVLKMTARFMGRQFRKSNMNLMSAIYMKVRHRFNDDWAFANDPRRTWDFAGEERALGVLLKRFNMRRYAHLFGEAGYVSAATDDHVARELASATAGGITANGGYAGRPPHGQPPPPAAKKSSVGTRPPAITLDADADDFEVRDEEADAAAAASIPYDDGSLRLEGIDPVEFRPYDNDLQSVLSWQPQFSERFRRNWRKWLQDEVLDHSIDWDFLLESTAVIAFEDRSCPAQETQALKTAQTAQ